MSMSNALDDLSREDMAKVIMRDRFVKEQQGLRITALLSENLEMLAIVQELQADLADARQHIEAMTTIPTSVTVEDVVAAAAGNGSQ